MTNIEKMSSSTADYLADDPPTIVCLEIKAHFEALQDKEKRYAHYLSRAAFYGTRITLRQVSAESEAIYDYILELYHSCNGNWSDVQKQCGLQDESMKAFLNFAAQFLGNCGNYKSFGDSKFIPAASFGSQELEKLSGVSEKAKSLHGRIGKRLFFTEGNPGHMHLGFPDAGHVSSYYPDSPSITKEEIQLVGDFLETKKLLAENTRLRSTSSGDYEVLIASAITAAPSGGSDAGPTTEWTLTGKLEGKKLRLVFGDYSEEMTKITTSIRKTRENAANEVERQMHEAYARHFETGSMQAFKDSQRFWIRDKGPMVECNIGFIETYRDPHGVRGEWEGFVAMVNQERTEAFGKLVASAESMISKLPWPKDFEKDKFLSPDFTSLEVLSFQGSGIPAGINIPNMDDIRMTEGFKNVSLGNVLSAKAPNEKIPFIKDEDQPLYQKYRDGAFEVQVGIHELLGHGTGKLFQELPDGTYNFDKANPPISPVTKKPIISWYKPGQTWGSVFGQIGASYEECRAECVAMALSCDFEILKIFGYGNGSQDTHGEAGDVLYTAYLSMARAGLAAVEFWDPGSKRWGQAHMQARFSILQCFLSAGDDFVKLSHGPESKDITDMILSLDRSKILSHGRPAVEAYLQKLHVYKSTADFTAGKGLYDEMTHVDNWWGSAVRKEVLRVKVPRKVFVQANTVIDEAGQVKLLEYEPTPEGMIRSWAERGV